MDESSEKPTPAEPASSGSGTQPGAGHEASTGLSPAEEKLDLPSEQKTWGMLCHLLALTPLVGIVPGLILGPLVVWLLKKNEMPFVDDQGKESMNFQITALIAFAASASLFLCGIGVIVMPIIGIVWMVLVIVAAVKAGDGVKYRYPWTLRFIK